MSRKVLLKYCRLLRPIWTLTWQCCKQPTMFVESRPPSKDDVYHNEDIGRQCLEEIGSEDLKPVYDYLRTEAAELTNVLFYCHNMGYTHSIRSSECQTLGYLLSIIRHRRRRDLITSGKRVEQVQRVGTTKAPFCQRNGKKSGKKESISGKKGKAVDSTQITNRKK